MRGPDPAVSNTARLRLTEFAAAGEPSSRMHSPSKAARMIRGSLSWLTGSDALPTCGDPVVAMQGDRGLNAPFPGHPQLEYRGGLANWPSWEVDESEP
jgi:hypothetical protein